MKTAWLGISLYWLTSVIFFLVRGLQHETWGNWAWVYVSCLCAAHCFHKYEERR